MDPWESFIAAHRVGDIVTGRVTKVVPFGAFVEVAEGVEGLLVVEDRPALGSTVPVSIATIDLERRRTSLAPA
jgi:small subunit ribosomal protein S1